MSTVGQGATSRPSPGTSVDGPVLEVAGATVRFGGVTALDEVDLSIARQEIVGVIGPNGAGKTTLFDLVSGFRRPTTGTIRLEGAEVTARSATWRARHGIRRTFQRQQVFTALSVRENLLVALEDEGVRGGVLIDILGFSGRRRSAAEHDRRVDETLAICGLDHVRDVASGSLPIGVARMIELARALVHKPHVLLLDEPTSGLDEAETAVFSNALRQHQASHRSSVVLVEHDVGFVMDHCDRVVVMDLGRVIASGTPADIRADPEVQRAYLG